MMLEVVKGEVRRQIRAEMWLSPWVREEVIHDQNKDNPHETQSRNLVELDEKREREMGN